MPLVDNDRFSILSSNKNTTNNTTRGESPSRPSHNYPMMMDPMMPLQPITNQADINRQFMINSAFEPDNLTRPPSRSVSRSLFISLFKLANPGLFSVYFWSFQANNTIFTRNQCEKRPSVHPVYSARIRTQSLTYMSHHP